MVVSFDALSHVTIRLLLIGHVTCDSCDRVTKKVTLPSCLAESVWVATSDGCVVTLIDAICSTVHESAFT